ncbi:hypothetical protein DOTSEDRAFT_125042 [Dothistroma septosporum NZE10]|uniref:cyclic pyranopterin monophosphate synthase n=1 Tax=Dothistroma septosporum (strain NZE10 / CBS 128990) TaxID=675120 RepID=N1PXH3_DOTSN|nr:hypothetical protein DOTSEDRAFT_125042 [Dothistroma septosporum NZE10]
MTPLTDHGLSQLTHLKATGEAHMVNVGGKANTKRVAIAFASVRFSNAKPHRLVDDNSNKKGDVLGVARIAGIMAAKRTPDLIPLCHPIAISKVEVDVKLIPAGGHRSTEYDAATRFGLVSILAQVECTGPTGVEMEALTAATSAALTVYDMCKAVDRRMQINHTTVVYKSGGKSGLHCSRKWGKIVGPQFFIERGLDLPGSIEDFQEPEAQTGGTA